MTPILQPNRWRAIALLVASTAALPTPVTAQGSVRQTPTAIVTMFERRMASFAEAIPHYVNGNAATGEQVLLAVDLHKPGTAEWSHEAGLRLYSMAIYLRSRGHEAGARQAVTQSVRQLDRAVTLALARGNSVVAARAHEQAGLIYDLFLADVKSALSRLEEAHRLNPGGKTAAQHLARAKQMDRQLAARAPGK
jgi:hypothetical protein